MAYTPYQTWNSDDKPSVASRASEALGEGQMAHADFMTSRICYHPNGADDAVFSVKDKDSGKELVRVNLPDLLTRLRTSNQIQTYSGQEFLDRCSDYHLTFFPERYQLGICGGIGRYVELECPSPEHRFIVTQTDSRSGMKRESVCVFMCLVVSSEITIHTGVCPVS